MKKIIAALVAAGFTVADDASEDAILVHVSAVIGERNKFSAENKLFIEARDARVLALVESAINDKVVAETRKDGLIKLGKMDESEVIAQIDELRKLVAQKNPRGVKPARKEGETEDGDATIAECQEKLRAGNISAEERGELAAVSIKARGLDNLFKKQTAVRN